MDSSYISLNPSEMIRVGVHGRPMEAENAQLVWSILDRMVANRLQPHLSPGFAEWLKNSDGRSIELDVLTEKELSAQDIDLVIGLGGDGTLLDTVALVGRSETPVLGINLGRLGFLSNVRLEEVDRALKAIRHGRYSLQDRSLLEVTDHKDKLGDRNFALNEVSVHKRDTSSMIAVQVRLNALGADAVVTEVLLHLEDQRRAIAERGLDRVVQLREASVGERCLDDDALDGLDPSGCGCGCGFHQILFSCADGRYCCCFWGLGISSTPPHPLRLP